ncbi:N-formylglutamate amidohydrolase [uncultured Sphingomonas sp.]|uniref:N-formylglutamate amidohydrolase n=1 Tax=uncultured Sphingomonas sp. TaxID=158754 RepID=UPI0025ED620D|nr:N-formylglutamate amidohydrolase [uncultured Sphingomonas sp.]
MTSWIDMDGAPSSAMLLVGDHASNAVPDGIDLGVPPQVMGEHVAIDIGVAPLAGRLCAALGCPGVLGGVSRLVIDLNREERSTGLIPLISDGWIIPGNADLTDAQRETRLALWRGYHGHVAELIAGHGPRLLISLHSFTPRLASGGAARPWQIGILYNQDERAARIALPLLEADGVIVGDNLPYSGKLLNATMNRHGEGNGIAYLGIEVRQDLIADEAGVALWADRLAPAIARVAEELSA